MIFFKFSSSDPFFPANLTRSNLTARPPVPAVPIEKGTVDEKDLEPEIHPNGWKPTQVVRTPTSSHLLRRRWDDRGPGAIVRSSHTEPEEVRRSRCRV